MKNGAYEKCPCWRVITGAYWAAVFNYIQNVPLLTFGLYCKGGIFGREAGEALTALASLSQGGRVPFVAIRDYNATPQEMNATHWPTSLQASVRSTGTVTAVTRCVDWGLVSNQLNEAFVGIASRNAVPSDPMLVSG